MRRIFLGFCRNWVLIDPLHYLSSHSAFGFEFAEIFIIEKRLPDSASWGVGFWIFKRKTRRVGESANRGVANSPTQQVRESSTPWLSESGSRHGESGSRYSNFLKFSIDFPDFKQLNQPFKRSIWQKSVMWCTITIDLFKNVKKFYL